MPYCHKQITGIALLIPEKIKFKVKKVIKDKTAPTKWLTVSFQKDTEF